MNLRFEFDRDRTLAAVVYLASKNIPRLDKYKICKLLFLADKRHLVRYGRLITGDTYFALNWGPVPSSTLHALSDEDPLAENIDILLKRRRGKYPSYSLRTLKPAKALAKKLIAAFLSKSDVEILDKIIEEHGQKTFDQLFAVTHAMPAYYKAWAKRGYANSAPMQFEHFFDDDDQAIQAIREELEERASMLEALSPDAAAIPAFDF